MKLCALNATESRSILPESKPTYIYSITFLVPAQMLMLLCCKLKKCELVAEKTPEKLDSLLMCCCEVYMN